MRLELRVFIQIGTGGVGVKKKNNNNNRSNSTILQSVEIYNRPPLSQFCSILKIFFFTI